MSYKTVLNATSMVHLTKGMSDVSETTVLVTVRAALIALNDFNVGKFHPDVYVTAKYLGEEVLQLIEEGSHEITLLAVE